VFVYTCSYLPGFFKKKKNRKKKGVDARLTILHSEKQKEAIVGFWRRALKSEK
jgi:peroxiredoxin